MPTFTSKYNQPSSQTKYITIALFLLSGLFGQWAFALQPLPPIDAFKAIMIDGMELPNAVGKPIKEFSLAAVIDDEMEPIPFQIDEYNEGGAVYFEDWGVPIVGSKDILDNEDKLLFIYKDAGPRLQAHHRYDGDIVQEITLSSSSGQLRYVYLMQNSRLISDEQYVRYSSDEAIVETDFYSITYDKENQLNWIDFSIVNYDGEENPFDSLKIRLETGIISSLIKTEINNESLIAIPKGERIGPIRTTTQMELTFWLLKLPILRVSLQLHHFPNSLLYDVRAILPAARRKMLVDPKVYLSLEGNKLYGTETRTAAGPTTPAITNGSIDTIEQQHIAEGISIEDNWIWATTLRNLDFLAFFDFNSERTQEISLHYNDELTVVDLPERFVGQLPNVGYKIHTLPDSGFFGFAVGIHLSNEFKGKPEIFSEQIRRLPDINVASPAQ
ncbi:hypothetical protein A9Q81_19205 [Gammaproteobacteria bacterium 42_54_T18]|nr:hypothetical protein A9Q81_19205 [Gammaproteobacteria bacterium 42_54_T18]